MLPAAELLSRQMAAASVLNRLLLPCLSAHSCVPTADAFKARGLMFSFPPTCMVLLQAADAFKAGGGGKRAQMKQLLAEAAVARRASGSKASTSGRDGAAAGAAAGQKSNGSAAAAASGEKDWRLQGPGKKFMPEFKPGKP
jgi:hypothetical protein